jgi:hypothetical protein
LIEHSSPSVRVWVSFGLDPCGNTFVKAGIRRGRQGAVCSRGINGNR